MATEPARTPASAPPSASELLRARLERRPASIPRAPGAVAPLTSTQLGIWYDAQVDPHATGHHRTTVVSLRGHVDPEALQCALDAVVARQPTLRTCYPMVDGRPVQRALEPTSTPIALVDATSDRDGVRRVIEAASSRAFDLEHAAPFDATLVRLGPDEHLLVLAVSHLSIDGPSAVRFTGQLADAYGAVRCGAEPAAGSDASFGDWTTWRSSGVDETRVEDELTWWALWLAGRAAPTPLALGGGELCEADPWAAATSSLPEDVTTRLRQLARAEAVTMNAVTLTAVATLAWEELGIDDLVVGMPVTDRDHADVEDVVGCFVRVLPVRLRIGAAETRRELLARVGATVAAVLDHRVVSMPEILWAVAPRDTSGRIVELVEVFVHHRRDRGVQTRREAGGVEFALVDLATVDVVPTLTVDDDGTTLRVGSGPLTDHLRRLADDPDRPLRSPARPPVSRSCPTGPNADEPSRDDTPLEATIPSLFEQVEQEHADRPAVVHGDQVTTYAQLGDLARGLAAELVGRGVGPGHTVGVRFERSLGGVVAMLGVVMAGAAYVPLDDQAPAARLASVVADAQLSAIVRPDGVELLHQDAGPLPIDPGPRAAVYVMYTSGSTGAPKGVVVHHRAVIQLVRDRAYAGYTPADVIAYASNPTFDTATLEVWGALLNGACLAVVDHDDLVDPVRLEAHIAAHRITALHLTTSLLHALVRRRPRVFSQLRLLSVGGEALDPAAMRSVVAAARPRRLINDYGPTETTTSASYYEITEVPDGATSVPIGRPLTAGSLHVLDHRGRPVPAGLPGELAIGGDGVALGYLGRPELTAARFVDDPFSTVPGARLYLTGDMVYRRPDGLIEFIGRVDTQEKVRGYRIELGEIESALLAGEDVGLAAVRVWRWGDGASIVAYAAPAHGQVLDADALLVELRDRLPAYMVPDRLVLLDELPRTPNGKVDRRALPSPRQAAPVSLADPWHRTDLEAMLAVWCRVLDLPAVDADADFFDLGGHSLRALSLLSAVEDSFGVELRLADLVGAPTPRRLTQVVVAHDRVGHQGGLIELSPGLGGGPVLHLVPAGVVVRYVSDYRALVRHLPPAVRVVTYEVPGLAPGTAPLRRADAMARWYAEHVSAVQPDGPLVLCGHSFGGTLALEAARRLRAQGRDVARVVMLDSRMKLPPISALRRARVRATSTARWLRSELRVRRGTDTLDRAQRDLFMATTAAFSLYRPSTYDGAVTLLVTEPTGLKVGRQIADEWRPYLPSMEVAELPGAHAGDDSMMAEPFVAHTAALVAAALGS